MAAPKIIDERTVTFVNFNELSIGDAFMNGNSLCTKTNVSSESDNAFDHTEGVRCDFSRNDRVQRVNIEIRILK